MMINITIINANSKCTKKDIPRTNWQDTNNPEIIIQITNLKILMNYISNHIPKSHNSASKCCTEKAINNNHHKDKPLSIMI